jgi:hypothetical protein
MRTYRTVKVVPKNGEVHLERLPFQPGDTVEVIVLLHNGKSLLTKSESLAGSVLRYDRPLEPVSEDEWNALQ